MEYIMSDYIVVQEVSRPELEKEVTRLVNLGYQPVGDVVETKEGAKRTLIRDLDYD